MAIALLQKLRHLTTRTNVGGGLLILTGFADTLNMNHFRLGWQSMLLILVGTLLCFTPLAELMPRLRQVKFKGIKVILSELNLPTIARKELDGLSAHDIWALDSFERAQITKETKQMNASQRVAARMLIDFKLMNVTGEGPNQQVDITPSGKALLEAARKLPI
jgi:hypothetical protein